MIPSAAPPARPVAHPGISDLGRLALWWGLVAGLVEGVLLLIFQFFDLLTWEMAMTPVSVKIIWISAAFDLVLFGCVGLLLMAVWGLMPRLRIMQAAFWILAFMALFDWSMITIGGRLMHRSAALLSAGLATVAVRWFRAHGPAALRFCRISLPWIAAAALVSVAGIEGGTWYQERAALGRLPAAVADAPDILVVVIDTLRADHLSSYGYARATTPHIDRLASEGVLFENAFSASSWTLPSHASMLTGRYPHDHGAQMGGLDTRYPTVAESLARRGYVTGAFSANKIYFTRSQGFGRGFVHFEDYFNRVVDMAVRTLYGRTFTFFVTQRLLGFDDHPARKRAANVNQGALAWIDRMRQDRPVFAFLNYFDAHDPYLPPEPYRSKFSRMQSPGGIINSFMLRLHPKMTPEQLQGEIDAYDGAVSYIDEYVGALVDRLSRRRNNLLVVVTSDHGEGFGEHGLFTHKNSLYKEVIHVPLVFWWPGHIPPGVRIGVPVTNTSLPATLLDLLGKTPNEFPAPSVAPLWRAPEEQRPWPMPLSEIARMPYASLREFKIPAYFGALASLVGPEYHYIENEKLGSELFNRQQDPGELRNLAAQPEVRPTLDEFKNRLRAALGRTPAAAAR